MENFRKEVRQMPTADLMLILEDQLELYSAEEIAVMRQELASRPSDALAREADAMERIQEAQIEKARQEARRKEREAEQQREKQRKAALESRKQSLRNQGYEGYYEYKTISLCDSDDGGLRVEEIARTLNDLALDGWRLVSAYTNELGRNSSSHGIGGMSSGTNSTVDQHILILERFRKL